MRPIELRDTRTGELLKLRPPGSGPPIGIYACGPTVYSRIHIGNARPFVVFSLLKRFLVHEGYAVNLVVNITDVNDKIYDAARPLARPSAELAAEMADLYRADTSALGLGRPDHEPLASETMQPIIEHIRTLVDGGHAYEAGGDVYFSVRSDQGYGSLSHRQLDDMDQGEGVEGSDRKRDPLDFALWKAHKPGEDTQWESPWGDGRPGWHIECSAMAEELLGVGFDIHGGGSDLVFPHHENEAAQTRAARGEELTRLWMHNGMIQFTGEKMAKSVGNIALLHEVLAGYGREAVVMYLVSGHYRQPLAFSEAALEQARANVSRIREVGRKLGPGATAYRSPEDRSHLEPFRIGFFDALAYDFGTPRALADLFEWIRGAGHLGVKGDGDLREMLTVLGLESLLAPDERAPGEVRALAEQRERARGERDFAEADRLRDEISALGWEVRDEADGFELLPL
ncbi:MAG TPA: cysteine--tRNA ligase [Solirubrobacteraceae bacterium]|nr:cysteine--tRNA ligase [Solirubrobacteraceae bacterium]